MDADWLEAFADGFFRLANRFDVALIGGDTTRGPLTVTVQLLGDAPAKPLTRAGAKAGDVVFVSGTLGDAAAALDQLRSGAAAPELRSDQPVANALLTHFYYPEPRIALGAALVGVASAAIDVSDGLLADLGHILSRSGCGAHLDVAALPLSGNLKALYSESDAYDFALGGGDDYELCFSVRPENRAAALAAADRSSTPITEIGQLTAEPGITALVGGQPTTMAPRGFTHF